MTDFDGQLKQLTYEEETAFLQPFIDAFLELQFTFTGNFFEGEKDSWQGGKITVSFDILFATLEEFLQDLKNEFEVFKLASGYNEQE